MLEIGTLDYNFTTSKTCNRSCIRIFFFGNYLKKKKFLWKFVRYNTVTGVLKRPFRDVQ